jgi:hypothetical protein
VSERKLRADLAAWIAEERARCERMAASDAEKYDPAGRVALVGSAMRRGMAIELDTLEKFLASKYTGKE